MLKKDILELINKFEMETWLYNDSEKLYSDMQYIYCIAKEVKNADESNLKPIYDKLISLMGIIRFKHGFESIIINNNPELANLKKIIDDITLDGSDTINQYNYVLTVYSNYTSQIKNLDFIENKYLDVQGKEGLYLALESLKSLITNGEYRQQLDSNQINELLIDCVKLNNGINIETIEAKYKEKIKQIWQHSLSNSIDENGKFRLLFSNIASGSLREGANLLLNRPIQSSCSMISSDFIATYEGSARKIGFIYPNDSEIIMASAYDLNSNVFGSGSRNKEKGTILATPEVIEKIGMIRATRKGEDLYSSSCYNEILVNSKPCGIVVLGLGEKDLNIDYQDAKILALEMNLPIYYIDTMQYKDKLSDADIEYIAYHTIMSFLGISATDLSDQDKDYNEVYKLINAHKYQIAEAFLTLKTEGNLNKENMYQAISNILDSNKTNDNIVVL